MPRTASTTATATISFQGVGLHYPSDPEGTFRLFQYGTVEKGSTVAMEAVAMKFVGRAAPVWDFGTTTEEDYKFTVFLPFGPTYASDMDALREFATTRDIICARDGRGRLLYGVVSAWSDADSMAGTAVTMTVSNADYIEGTS